MSGKNITDGKIKWYGIRSYRYTCGGIRSYRYTGGGIRSYRYTGGGIRSYRYTCGGIHLYIYKILYHHMYIYKILYHHLYTRTDPCNNCWYLDIKWVSEWLFFNPLVPRVAYLLLLFSHQWYFYHSYFMEVDIFERKGDNHKMLWWLYFYI
jgi:hypothetical protein